LATLLAAPFTWNLVRGVGAGTSGAELIPFLAKTGKLQLVFAVLFAVGLAI
jgi:1,4-dihydroxy-2-naphthoate polyprenyltransferase